MLGALERAIQVYRHRDQWWQLVGNAMSQDFSWHRSAQEYARLYDLLAGT
jgi:starch synthase